MEILVDSLLWFTTISVAIMAGVYFTFSTFVMRSLAEIAAPAGMLAMQSINRVIVKSIFLPIFFGSTLASAALVALALFQPAKPGARYMAIGAGLYFIGMFVVTVARNVPLNNRLEATAADGPEGADIWALYLSKWTAWNHIRTVSCTGSLALLIMAIGVRM